MQTKLESVIEKIVDLVIALFISTFLQIYLIEEIFAVGIIQIEQSFSITLIFTLVSFVRGYFVRRFFNQFQSVKEIK